MPLDVWKASGSPGICQISFSKFRLRSEIGGIASKIIEPDSRKGRAFPHIRRPSRSGRYAVACAFSFTNPKSAITLRMRARLFS